MKELSLSVSTGGEGKDNTVVITGKFDTHQEAVLFHAQVAKFCADATRPQVKTSRPFTGLLSYKGRGTEFAP